MEIIRSVTGENIIIKTTEILYIFLSMIKQLESLLKKHPKILYILLMIKQLKSLYNFY